MRDPRGPGLATVFASLLFAAASFDLALPALAAASRAPHAIERVEITRAAVATDGGPTLLIRVSGIRISTVGPWAIATVDTYQRRFPKHVLMSAVETFYREGNQWLDTNSVYTPERTPPDAVVRDLGLAPNPTKGGGGLSTVEVIVIVVVVLALLSAIGGAGLSRGRTFGGGSTPPTPDEATRSVPQGWQMPPPRREEVVNRGTPCGKCGTDGFITYSDGTTEVCSSCGGKGFV